MAAVSPVGNAYYVNQAAPLVSQQVANIQSAAHFQAALAQQMFAEKDLNVVEGVIETNQDSAIGEKEHEEKSFYGEQQEHKHKQDESNEQEHVSDHILDLKA